MDIRPSHRVPQERQVAAKHRTSDRGSGRIGLGRIGDGSVVGCLLAGIAALVTEYAATVPPEGRPQHGFWWGREPGLPGPRRGRDRNFRVRRTAGNALTGAGPGQEIFARARSGADRPAAGEPLRRRAGEAEPPGRVTWCAAEVWVSAGGGTTSLGSLPLVSAEWVERSQFARGAAGGDGLGQELSGDRAEGDPPHTVTAGGEDAR